LHYATTGDGIVAGLQVIAAMIRARMSLSEIASGFTKFPQKLINVKYIAGKNNPLDADSVKNAVLAAEKEMGNTGRVLLRKSGTEPLIRVMVEAEDKEMSDKWASAIAEEVKALKN
jgi:phosphoglucosamine mutase